MKDPIGGYYEQIFKQKRESGIRTRLTLSPYDHYSKAKETT